MRFTARTATELCTLTDSFYCRSKRRVIQLENCLDDYVNANSFEQRRSACFRCPIGRRNREAYASGSDSD